MPDQYSDSSRRADAPHVLALDGGSPRVSVALGRAGRVLAAREGGGGEASSSLLRLVDEVLAEAGIALAAIDRFVALRGPGSFTGLRVALATVLGLHQATGRPATAVSTLETLAWQARAGGGRVVPVVDALRGEWFAQPFALGGGTPRAEAGPAILGAADLRRWAPCRIVGFDVGKLAAADLPSGIEVAEAGPLAPALVELAHGREIEWDPARLATPLYLRPVAAKRGG